MTTSKHWIAVVRDAWSVRGARVIAAVSLLVAVPLAIRMALDAGITSDEFVQRTYGDMVLAWYRSGFTDRAALSFRDLYLYGGLFDLAAQGLNASGLLPWDDFDVRHVLSSLVAVGGIVATWLTVQRVAGSRAALLAAALLALTPAWIGHGLFNPKDIPFGAAAAFVMYASARIVMRRPPLHWVDAAWACAAFGCALGVRSGGMFMLAYPLLAVALRGAVELRRRPLRRCLHRAAISTFRLACALPLSWALMLSAWPWAQQEPFTRPFTAAATAAHFSWHGQLRFGGRLITDANMPASYLPTWFAITLPDLYVLALVCGLVAAITTIARRRVATPRAAAVMLLLLLVAAPLLAVMIRRPTIYNGHRHFLFLLPPMAALGGLAFHHVLSGPYPALLRRGVGTFVLLLAALTAYDMVALHPYQYVYFNRVSGGLRKQGPRYEMDYWGSTYREAFAWVVRNYDIGGTRRIAIKSCSADKTINYYRKLWHAERFVIAKSPRTAEVFLDLDKLECRELPGEEIHRVERAGEPLLYVLRPSL